MRAPAPVTALERVSKQKVRSPVVAAAQNGRALADHPPYLPWVSVTASNLGCHPTPSNQAKTLADRLFQNCHRTACDDCDHERHQRAACRGARLKSRRSRQATDRHIAAVQEWIAENYSRAAPVAAMVECSTLPERSFKRRFTQATGLSTPCVWRRRSS
jgi:hypothetical protein